MYICWMVPLIYLYILTVTYLLKSCIFIKLTCIPTDSLTEVDVHLLKIVYLLTPINIYQRQYIYQLQCIY